MTAITINQKLLTSCELFNLADLLEKDEHLMLGHLIRLFMWATEHGDMDLTAISIRQVAKVMGWMGDDEELWSALVQSGIVNREDDGTCTLQFIEWQPA